MAYSLSNKRTKNVRKRTVLVQLIVEDVFLERTNKQTTHKTKTFMCKFVTV